MGKWQQQHGGRGLGIRGGLGLPCVGLLVVCAASLVILKELRLVEAPAEELRRTSWQVQDPTRPSGRSLRRAPDEPEPDGASLEDPGEATQALERARGLLLEDGPPQNLSRETLTAAAERLAPRFRACCSGIEPRFDSVLRLEAIALVSAISLTRLDVIIESGTASGYSAEVMARFFAGTPPLIYAIDKDSEGRNDTSAAMRRLSFFPNVVYISGDSIDWIPKLLERHKGQRIGVFVDGPKGSTATFLCRRTVLSSPDVKFVAQHDVATILEGRLVKEYEEWGRTVLLTSAPEWLDRFGWLDDCPKEGSCGWGLAMVAGLDAYPADTAGDRNFSAEVWEKLLRPGPPRRPSKAR